MPARMLAPTLLSNDRMMKPEHVNIRILISVNIFICPGRAELFCKIIVDKIIEIMYNVCRLNSGGIHICKTYADCAFHDINRSILNDRANSETWGN